MLIDSHAHLDFEDYGKDRAEVIGRARAAGVGHVVLIGQWREPKEAGGSGLWSAREALALAKTDRSYFTATAGVHPHDAVAASESDFTELRELCRDEAIAAVGECGLDFHYDRSPRDVQGAVFERQVALAKELGKPVVVHTREADVETAGLLARALGQQGGAIHCFTSDWTAARRYLDIGMYISIAGVVTFKTAEALRDAARRIPLDRLLVETDCPFLAPVPHRGKRNEPAFVAVTARMLAELRKEPFDAFSEATTANARKLLRLPTV
jgi:TatD DNase family protein